ncbi:MAG: SulP family inorganic anion transporter, partial [Gammaproteobacteria bacterium]|nr:SulP family inorganic anion transporter [Gammaproteobacteria bacterium]
MLDPSITWTAIGQDIPYIGGFPLTIPHIGEIQPHPILVREFPLDPFMIGSIINQGISYSSNLLLNVPLVPPDLPLVKTGGLFSIDSSMTWMIIQFAATIAALGAIDSLLTSVVADNITKTKHNSHRELIGQGIGNVASGLVGGLPGAGATMRTIVNINAGGKTRLSGLTHGLLLFAILL